jgi:hypothetical protein
MTEIVVIGNRDFLLQTPIKFPNSDDHTVSFHVFRFRLKY